MNKFFPLVTNFTNWYLRILERFGLVTGDITYKLRKPKVKFTFKAQPLNTPFWIIQDMLYHDPYNDHSLDFGSQPTVIDIGGNIGSFSVLQAFRVPNARIFVYEADSTNFEYLQKNITENALETRVKPFNFAVTGQSNQEQVKIYEHADKGSNSLHIRKQGLDEKTFKTVETKSLKQIFADHAFEVVDMIKMDVEGSEYEILYNSKEQIEKTRFIALEYHDLEGESPEKLKTFIESCDFEVNKTSSHIWQCKNRRFI